MWRKKSLRAKPSSNVVIVTPSGFPGVLARLRRYWKPIAIGAGLVLVIIFAALALHKEPEPKVVADVNIPSDYALMTKEQIAIKLQADTGLKIADLQTKNISGRTFKDFRQAYIGGQALNGMHDYERAGKAYAVALKRAPKDAPASFYLRYAAVAGINKETELVTTLEAKAVEAIKADPNLSDQDKAEQVAKIGERDRLRKLGY